MVLTNDAVQSFSAKPTPLVCGLSQTYELEIGPKYITDGFWHLYKFSLQREMIGFVNIIFIQMFDS